MLWGYHTIFPSHKYTLDKADSPPHPSDAGNDNAADDDADNNAADNNADNDADVDTDNNNATQMMDDDADTMWRRQRMTT